MLRKFFHGTAFVEVSVQPSAAATRHCFSLLLNGESVENICSNENIGGMVGQIKADIFILSCS